MKKVLNYSFALFAGITVALACSKVDVKSEITDPDSPGQDAKKQVSISVSISEEGLTRVAFTESESDKSGGMKLSWEVTDVLDINGEEFTIAPGSISTDGKTATFEGPELGAGPYTITYIDGEFTPQQTQQADADTGHLKYYASLTGVDSYQDIAFTQAWAEEHNGTFLQSGILRLRAQMPTTEIAASVREVKITAFDADGSPLGIFQGDNALTLTLTDQVDTDEDKILDLYFNLPTWDAEIPANASIIVRFKTDEPDAVFAYTRYHTFTEKMVLTPGTVNALKLNCTATGKHAGNKSFCDGTTAEKAYLIGDKYQMNAMHEEIVSGATRYFKLIDNIDLAGIEWIPLNNAKVNNSFGKYVVFDGNNKTISHLTTSTTAAYPGLFGVFNGVAKDLTIADSEIMPTSDSNNKGGVFASYIGSSDATITPAVSNITIQNCKVGSSSNRMGNYAGGLCAQVEKDGANVTNVSVINTDIYGPTASSGSGGVIGYIRCAGTFEKLTSNSKVYAYQYVGGVIGAVNVTTSGKTATISKCWFTGSVSAKNRFVGGLVGGNVGSKGTVSISDCYVTGNVDGSYGGGILGLHQSNSTEATNLTNCYVTGYVKGTFGAGGIVGNSTKDGLSVIRCMPFNSEIRSTATDEAQHYSSGAVIAYAKGVKVVVSYCYRISDMANRFSDCPGNSANVIEQHAFITEPATIPQRQGLTYGYYHHGRNTKLSLCDLVHSGVIGEDWSSEVWDWSGEIPVLR